MNELRKTEFEKKQAQTTQLYRSGRTYRGQLDQVTGGVPSVNQQATPPGQFPGGNPAKAHGSSNEPGNSG
jgi:hypothetical protein